MHPTFNHLRANTMSLGDPISRIPPRQLAGAPRRHRADLRHRGRRMMASITGFRRRGVTSALVGGTESAEPIAVSGCWPHTPLNRCLSGAPPITGLPAGLSRSSMNCDTIRWISAPARRDVSEMKIVRTLIAAKWSHPTGQAMSLKTITNSPCQGSR